MSDAKDFKNFTVLPEIENGIDGVRFRLNEESAFLPMDKARDLGEYLTKETRELHIYYDSDMFCKITGDISKLGGEGDIEVQKGPGYRCQTCKDKVMEWIS